MKIEFLILLQSFIFSLIGILVYNVKTTKNFKLSLYFNYFILLVCGLKLAYFICMYKRNITPCELTKYLY